MFFTSDPGGTRKERWSKDRGLALIKWRAWAIKQTNPPDCRTSLPRPIKAQEQARKPWSGNEASAATFDRWLVVAGRRGGFL